MSRPTLIHLGEVVLALVVVELIEPLGTATEQTADVTVTVSAEVEGLVGGVRPVRFAQASRVAV